MRKITHNFGLATLAHYHLIEATNPSSQEMYKPQLPLLYEANMPFDLEFSHY